MPDPRTQPPVKILFVCLGNICRSSAAEEIFRCHVAQNHLSQCIEVDSAGLIDYHEGELSDARMIRHAAHRGYRLTHRSRPIREEDFVRFDYIVGMDAQNMRRLNHGLKQVSARQQDHVAQLLLMADFLQRYDSPDIPDPYYGTDADFQQVINLLEDASPALLRHILADAGM